MAFLNRFARRTSAHGVRGRRLRWALATFGLVLGVTSPAWALPVTYGLMLDAGVATGTLGSTPFNNAWIGFSFQGDTDDVVPYSVPGASGYELLQGTATVGIYDQNTMATLSATFLPSAGIFVSVDNTNSGIGFGSGGVPVSAAGFPGDPVYPASLLAGTGTVASYDLKSNITLSGFSISCSGFPATCASVGPSLPTTAGDLIIDHIAITSSSFSTLTDVPFSRFVVNETVTTNPASFKILALITLGSGNNGINPLGEAVTLRSGLASFTLPPGSFSAHGNKFSYNGTVDGFALSATITTAAANSFMVEFDGSVPSSKRLPTGPTGPLPLHPATVELTIGNDSGTTTSKIVYTP
jgi:hypothetical protein